MEYGTYFKPMLLKETDNPFDDREFIYEIKFDGIRATLHVDPKDIKVFSRNGTNLTDTFPELKSICKLVKRKTILDGEIVAFKDGLPDFSTLQRRNLLKNKIHITRLTEEIPILFVAFDCLYDGRDLTKMPLFKRKEILDSIEENASLAKVSYIFTNGKKLFEKAKKKNLEGIVAKRRDSLYYPNTRSSDWIKIKNFTVENFIIGGYIDNKAKSSLILGEYRMDKLYFVGKVSIERRSELYQKIKREKKKKTSPFADRDDKNDVYIKPKIKCPISYIERTESNHLRQPVLKEKRN